MTNSLNLELPTKEQLLNQLENLLLNMEKNEDFYVKLAELYMGIIAALSETTARHGVINEEESFRLSAIYNISQRWEEWKDNLNIHQTFLALNHQELDIRNQNTENLHLVAQRVLAFLLENHPDNFCRLTEYYLTRKTRMDITPFRYGNFDGQRMDDIVNSVTGITINWARAIQFSIEENLVFNHLLSIYKNLKFISLIDRNNFMGASPFTRAMTDAEFKTICGELTRAKNITSFSLSACNLNITTPVRLEILANLFQSFPLLNELNLASNHLGDVSKEAWSNFCNFLGQQSQLKSLNLYNNNLCARTPAELAQLGDALAKLENLENIKIHENGFEQASPEQLMAFFSALARSPQKIKGLFFETRDLSIPSAEDNENAGEAAGSAQPPITKLTAFTQGLNKLLHLESLELVMNGWTNLKNEQWDNLINTLRTILTQHPNLQSLKFASHFPKDIDADRWLSFIKVIESSSLVAFEMYNDYLDNYDSKDGEIKLAQIEQAISVSRTRQALKTHPEPKLDIEQEDHTYKPSNLLTVKGLSLLACKAFAEQSKSKPNEKLAQKSEVSDDALEALDNYNKVPDVTITEITYTRPTPNKP